MVLETVEEEENIPSPHKDDKKRQSRNPGIRLREY